MVNPFDLNKKDLLEFTTGHCRQHRMPYSQHPKCYEKDKGIPLKIGYFDIESGGFNANFDIILCYSIKTRDKDEILRYAVNKNDYINETFDKNLCKQLVKDLMKYDVIITFYGTKFDIPFVRSRCLSYRLNFPLFGVIKHKDVYYIVKHKMKLHKSSLESACALLNIKGKNHIKGNYWMKAKYGGNPVALKYVQDHCDKDVIILERLHKKIEVFVKNTMKSI
jgi:uncharacterized protein YprB with RNaseH-like and TPR domain